MWKINCGSRGAGGAQGGPRRTRRVTCWLHLALQRFDQLDCSSCHAPPPSSGSAKATALHPTLAGRLRVQCAEGAGAACRGSTGEEVSSAAGSRRRARGGRRRSRQLEKPVRVGSQFRGCWLYSSSILKPTSSRSRRCSRQMGSSNRSSSRRTGSRSRTLQPRQPRSWQAGPRACCV